MNNRKRFELSHEQIGEITERKFVSALTCYRASWLVSVERAPLEWDMRGVDVKVKIRCFSGEIVTLPIQIKSTQHYRNEFVRENRNSSNIICLVVGLKDDPIHICLNTYRVLTSFRRKRESNEKFLTFLSQPAEGKGLEVIQKIWQSRARPIPVNPHKIKPSTLWERLYLWFVYQ